MIFWTEWLPLTAQQVDFLSDVSGLYEVKVDGRLVDYPSGRSAMIYYGATDAQVPGLQSLVRRDWLTPEKAAILRQWQEYGPVVFRWAAAENPAPEHARRVRLFLERFGRAPWGNPAQESG